MAEKKEKIVIDFDKVVEEIKFSEEMKLCNIYKELGFKNSEVPKELLKYPVNPNGSKYSEYLQWLKDSGIDWYRFYYR